MNKKTLLKRVATFFALGTFICSLFPARIEALATDERDKYTYNEESSQEADDNNLEKEDFSSMPTGLIEPTEESKNWLKNNSTVVTNVNELQQLKNSKKQNNNMLKNAAPSILPSKVDLPTDEKTEKYFPKISYQYVGACVSYANTYYCMTYMTNKELNRESTIENTMSPIWTYNLTNYGVDGGSLTSNCLKVLKEIGSVTIEDVPVETSYNVSPNYTTDYHAQPELNLYEKAKQYQIDDIINVKFADESEDTPITSAKDDNLNVIKKVLNDGNILSFSTTIYDFCTTSLKTNAEVPENSKFANEQAVYTCDGNMYGGHEMTLVGYNDDIWIDVNNNNKIDDGEMGAFKIVNSWGKNYGNDGFIWVAYDALNKVSSVNGYKGYNNKRPILAGYELNTFTIKKEADNEKLYLEVTFDTNNREALRMTINNGECTDKDTYLYPFSFDGMNSYDEGISLDGSNNVSEGKMSFDLAAINENYTLNYIMKNGLTFKIEDIIGQGNYTHTIKEVKLKDKKNNKEYLLKAKNNDDYSICNSFSSFYLKESEVSTPSELNVINTDSGYKLEWPKVDNIEGYEIYRNDNLIAKTKENYYEDDNFATGKSTYLVRAYTNDNRYSNFVKKQIKNNRVKVLAYNNSQSYIKYKIGNGNWSSELKMNLNSNSSDCYYSIIDLDNYNDEDIFVMVKSEGKWSNRYKVTPGIYEIRDNKASEVYDSLKLSAIASKDVCRAFDSILVSSNITGGSGKYDINICYGIYPGYEDIKYDFLEQGGNVFVFPKEPGKFSVVITVDDLITGEHAYFEKKLNILPAEEFSIESINFDKNSPQEINTPINISCKVNRDSEFIKYTYEIIKDNKIVSTSNKSDTFNWIPDEKGTYTVKVIAEDTKSGQKAEKSTIYKVTSSEETTVHIYYKGYNNPNIHYKIGDNGFWTSAPGIQMEKCDELEGYSYKSTIDLGDEGNLIACFNNGAGQWDSNGGKNYTFTPGYYTFNNGIITKIEKPTKKLEISSFTSNVGDKMVSGNQAIFKAQVKNATGNVQYRYSYKNNTTGESGVIRNYSQYSNLSWMMSKEGNYTITVEAKDDYTVTSKSLNITIVPYEYLKIQSVTSSLGDTFKEGNETNLTINTTGGKGLNYYSITVNGESILNSSSSNSVTWKPEKAGTYKIVASAREVYGGSSDSYEKTITVTEKSKNVTTIYYKGYENPYIHYSVGGKWTAAPGIKMMPCTDVEGYNYKAEIDLGEATSLTACFNNGAGQWDSNGGKNYSFNIGTYGYCNGNIVPIGNEKNEITIYYKGYDTPYMHYKIGNGAWTSAPGVKMEKTNEMSGYTHKLVVNLGNCNDLTACFNNGNGSWDSRNGANYYFSQAGTYTYSNGSINKIK